MVHVPLPEDEVFNAKMRVIADLDQQAAELEIASLFDPDGYLAHVPYAAMVIHKARESDDLQVLAGVEKVIEYAKTKSAPQVRIPLMILGILPFTEQFSGTYKIG